MTSRSNPALSIDDLIALVVCPDCRQTMRRTDTRLICDACQRAAQVTSSQIQFESFTEETLKQDWLNRFKQWVKQHLWSVYPTLIALVSPVMPVRSVPRFLQSFSDADPRIVDLGAGTNRYRQPVVCFDGAPYPTVHVVSRLESLPLADDSVDGVISVAVLEHVPCPEQHVKEMHRVLRPGGRVLCFIPFIQGYHASPHDYQRYTTSGMRELFQEFELISLDPIGPTSGFLWILQEWLALCLSFGSQSLYRVLLPLMWILSPIKWLDLLLQHHPNAAVIATGHYVEARKPAGDAQDALQ